MTSHPIGLLQSIRFGEDFELELRPRRVRHFSQVLKLERIPLEILILLIERQGEIVSRDEIATRVWGSDVLLDTDNSIRGAIRKIRQVLKDDPEQPRFIQTVTGQGYRFIAPIIGTKEEHGADASSGLPFEEPETPTAETDEGSHQASRAWYKLTFFAVVLVALAGVLYTIVRNRQGQALRPQITSIAVLPFTNLSGDPAQDYLADGMTEEIIGRLSSIRGLRVISRTSTMHFKETQLPVPEIAKALHVDALVEGSVIREGSRIRVHAQLIRGSTDEHFWSESYDRELVDVLALESDVAQAIAAKVEVTVT